jgi:hypothetical protein
MAVEFENLAAFVKNGNEQDRKNYHGSKNKVYCSS